MIGKLFENVKVLVLLILAVVVGTIFGWKVLNKKRPVTVDYGKFYRRNSEHKVDYDAPRINKQTDLEGPYGPYSAYQHLLFTIKFPNRDRAEDILVHLVEMIEEFGNVTVAEFFEMAKVNTGAKDKHYGWTDLDGAYVQHANGDYRIVLPNPKQIPVHETSDDATQELLFANVEGGVLQEVFSTVKGQRLVVIDQDKHSRDQKEMRVLPWKELDPKYISKVREILKGAKNA